MHRKIKVLLLPESREHDELLNVISIRRETNENITYDSNKISITVNDNGAIYFSADSGESFIYFYPDQLKHLSAAVQLANKAARVKK